MNQEQHADCFRAAAASLCARIEATLADRNRLCKLNK